MSEIDSFQDPCVLHRKLTPFKTLWSDIYREMSEIDSFQDPCVLHQNCTHFKTMCSDLYGKTSQIDTFQDSYVLHPNRIPFKTLYIFGLKLDSFQDPCAVNCIWNITQLTHFKTLIIGLLQCFNLRGRLPAKSPWETSFIHNPSKHHTQWNSDFFMKQRRKIHHMQVINTFQHPRHNTFYTWTPQYSSKLIPFKTPETSHQPFTAVSV